MTKELLAQLIIKLLKMQALGGFRGWLLRLLVGNFSEYIIEIFNDLGEYNEISKKVDSTIDEEDRDAATNTLNDILN